MGPTANGKGGRERGREGRYGKGREERGGERKGRNGKGTHSSLDPVPLLFLQIYTPMVKSTERTFIPVELLFPWPDSKNFRSKRLKNVPKL